MFKLVLLAGCVVLATSKSAKTNICKTTCDFEEGTACNYTSSFEHDGGKDNPQFLLHINSFGSGEYKVPNPAKGKVYLAATVGPGKLAYIISPEFPKTVRKRVAKFKYYDNTPGINIKGCLTADTAQCSLIGKGNTDETHWRSGSYNIPIGSFKFGLLAENLGDKIGSIGLDEIAIEDC